MIKLGSNVKSKIHDDLTGHVVVYEPLNNYAVIMTDIIEYEIDNPDILEEWADLFDAHEVLHNVKKEYEDKLAKAQAKQPKAEW